MMWNPFKRIIPRFANESSLISSSLSLSIYWLTRKLLSKKRHGLTVDAKQFSYQMVKGIVGEGMVGRGRGDFNGKREYHGPEEGSIG